MQSFMLALICCVMSSDFIVQSFALPSILRFLPEGMSAVVVLYVLFAGTRDRFQLVAPKYWLAFGALGVVIVCGAINNDTGAGPISSGLRFYLRAVPLFFLPATLPFSERQLKQQFNWLLGAALLQIPVAVYQRWTIMQADRYSGDDVKGTVMDSGILSMFLICAVLVLTGLLLRRRISKLWYATLFLVLLIPTTINETKGTIILLPIGLLVTLLVGSESGKRWRYTGMALIVMSIFGAAFIPVYNSMEVNNPWKQERNLIDFFTDKKNLQKYMSSNVAGVGTTQDVRRGDAIVVPLQYLAQDPTRLAFGLGIGNVSASNMGKSFEGAYFGLFQKFLITSFTVFLLELGGLGVIIVAVLFWLVFMDTLTVARNDKTLLGAMAAGWTGVIVLFVVGLFYTIFHEFTSVTYLYWYFSGIICARRVSLAHERQYAPHPASNRRIEAMGQTEVLQ